MYFIPRKPSKIKNYDLCKREKRWCFHFQKAPFRVCLVRGAPQWPCQVTHCRKLWIAPNFFRSTLHYITFLTDNIQVLRQVYEKKSSHRQTEHQKRLYSHGFKSLQWFLCLRTNFQRTAHTPCWRKQPPRMCAWVDSVSRMEGRGAATSRARTLKDVLI